MLYRLLLGFSFETVSQSDSLNQYAFVQAVRVAVSARGETRLKSEFMTVTMYSLNIPHACNKRHCGSRPAVEGRESALFPSDYERRQSETTAPVS